MAEPTTTERLTRDTGGSEQPTNGNAPASSVRSEPPEHFEGVVLLGTSQVRS